MSTEIGAAPAGGLLLEPRSTLMIHPDGVATWPDGTILTSDEIEAVCARLREGVGKVSPEDIAAHNAAMLDERRRAQGLPPKREEPAPRPGTVYLLRCQDRYKIGISRALHARIETLAGQSPYPIDVVHTVDVADPKRLESELHRGFDGSRRHGEWFDLMDEQVQTAIQAMNDWSATA